MELRKLILCNIYSKIKITLRRIARFITTNEESRNPKTHIVDLCFDSASFTSVVNKPSISLENTPFSRAFIENPTPTKKGASNSRNISFGRGFFCGIIEWYILHTAAFRGEERVHGGNGAELNFSIRIYVPREGTKPMQKREGGTKSRSFFTIGSSFEWRGFPVEQLDITTTACSLSLLSFFLFFSPNESRGKGEMEGASEGGGIFSGLRRGDRNQRSADPCEFSRFFESGILKKVCVCPQRGVRKESFIFTLLSSIFLLGWRFRKSKTNSSILLGKKSSKVVCFATTRIRIRIRIGKNRGSWFESVNVVTACT